MSKETNGTQMHPQRQEDGLLLMFAATTIHAYSTCSMAIKTLVRAFPSLKHCLFRKHF